MRYLPLTGMLLFVAVAVGWRSWLQRRRYGSSGIMFFRSRRHSQMVRDGLSIVWFALLLGQAIAAAAWPDWLSARSLVTGAATDVLRATGAALLIGGLVDSCQASAAGATRRLSRPRDISAATECR